MKHYNDFLIEGIDHGYGNIKTANTVTPTGITRLDAAPTFTKNTLFFEGSYYQIGEGHKEYHADKWQDEDNYIFTLMGIALEMNRESITSAKVYLAVGLPITANNRTITVDISAVIESNSQTGVSYMNANSLSCTFDRKNNYINVQTFSEELSGAACFPFQG